jgi:5-methylcytosine-specific restriction enzyme subunit McrC
MLRQSGMIQTDAPSSANLRLKSNSILDLYIEQFISECEYLIHRGLIKRYRKIEGNRSSLKGAIVFGKHISQNITHKERFYVKHTTYDVHHLLNQILLKTIKLIVEISNATDLKSRVSSLLLYFPELSEISVSEALFERIALDRKSEHYRKALTISKLLLLNYHPDITKGREPILALMFDMNLLWEKWVLRQIQKACCPRMSATGQSSLTFWSPTAGWGYSKTLRPDIVLEFDNQRIIIDTKWKLPKDERPGDDDLKQMFSYNNRFDSKRSILLYPGNKEGYSGQFYHAAHGSCDLMFLDVLVDGQLSSKGIQELFNKIECTNNNLN